MNKKLFLMFLLFMFLVPSFAFATVIGGVKVPDVDYRPSNSYISNYIEENPLRDGEQYYSVVSSHSGKTYWSLYRAKKGDLVVEDGKVSTKSGLGLNGIWYGEGSSGDGSFNVGLSLPLFEIVCDGNYYDSRDSDLPNRSTLAVNNVSDPMIPLGPEMTAGMVLEEEKKGIMGKIIQVGSVVLPKALIVLSALLVISLIVSTIWSFL